MRRGGLCHLLDVLESHIISSPPFDVLQRHHIFHQEQFELSLGINERAAV